MVISKSMTSNGRSAVSPDAIARAGENGKRILDQQARERLMRLRILFSCLRHELGREACSISFFQCKEEDIEPFFHFTKTTPELESALKKAFQTGEFESIETELRAHAGKAKAVLIWLRERVDAREPRETLLTNYACNKETVNVEDLRQQLCNSIALLEKLEAFLEGRRKEVVLSISVFMISSYAVELFEERGDWWNVKIHVDEKLKNKAREVRVDFASAVKQLLLKLNAAAGWVWNKGTITLTLHETETKFGIKIETSEAGVSCGGKDAWISGLYFDKASSGK